MTKRVIIVALVVAACLLVAAPAFAFNGMRGDYTVSGACRSCHDVGAFGAPIVGPNWALSKHGTDEAYAEVANRVPIGSVCQGCHTANFDPSKMTPTPTATATAKDFTTPTPVATATNVSWGATTDASQPQSTGNGAWSEGDIGCSSCHYGAGPGIGPNDGHDANDTAHQAPYGNLADAQICGACHSRYAYTVGTYPVATIPYVKLDGTGAPIPNPSPTPSIQPQMALGYAMLGSPSPAPAWSPVLADSLVVPSPGWTPAPTATAAGLGMLQTYWQIDGTDSPWQQTGHDGSAAQYSEWASEGLRAGHADALAILKSVMGPNPPATCLECHSADYRISVEAGKPAPTGAQTKYGVTCVGCHTPHDAGTTKGRWDEGFDAQLIGDPANPSDLCTTCHNAEIPAGSTLKPGAEVHHPMKEMMDGYGAIDVSAFPSVHKGKCVQCHMPPTSLSRGSVQLGGNHTFNIITPKDANDASPIPVATATTSAVTKSGVTTINQKVTWDSMPYSACSTCHNNNNGTTKQPVPVSTVTATPDPTNPNRVTITVNQLANGTAWGNHDAGDKALWLQDTIDQRQSWTKAKVAEIWSALDVAAHNLGYATRDAAHTALTGKAANTWTTAERAFLSAWTNNEFVDSEGSYGLHNWDYSREIVNKAMEQAKVAQTGVVVKLPWVVTFKMSKSSVKAGTKVTFSGTVMTAKGVPGAGQARIMKLVSGVWKVWKYATLNGSGAYSITVKMTSKGTFYLTGLMPADSLNLQGQSSPRLKLVVK